MNRPVNRMGVRKPSADTPLRNRPMDNPVGVLRGAMFWAPGRQEIPRS